MTEAPRDRPQAPLKRTDHGLEPDGDGWFVINATEAPWITASGLGRAAIFESRDHEFPELGINIHVLDPGEPNCMYHGESSQEGFLVLAGECTLIVEGQERPLRRWDYAHFPPWTRHVVVNTGAERAVILMVGTRKDPDEVVYPVDPVARRHNAGVAEETTDAKRAYAHVEHRGVERYRPGDLPGA